MFWNGKQIAFITPNDYKIHNNVYPVKVEVGDNNVKFEGAGVDDSYGLTIDNVKFIRKGTSTDLAENGGFEKPDLGKGWKVFPEIPGWKGKGIEVGWGKIYNKDWNSQIVELDGHKHGYLSQIWTFNSSYALQK